MSSQLYKINNYEDTIKIPNNITHITFGDYFNDNMIIPTLVTHLSFGYNFSKKIKMSNSITHIFFRHNFNQEINLNDNSLCNLTHLIFGDNFNKYFVVPESVIFLKFGYDFNQKIIIPNKVTHLFLGNRFDCEIKIPSTTILIINKNKITKIPITMGDITPDTNGIAYNSQEICDLHDIQSINYHYTKQHLQYIKSLQNNKKHKNNKTINLHNTVYLTYIPKYNKYLSERVKESTNRITFNPYYVLKNLPLKSDTWLYLENSEYKFHTGNEMHINRNINHNINPQIEYKHVNIYENMYLDNFNKTSHNITHLHVCGIDIKKIIIPKSVTHLILEKNNVHNIVIKSPNITHLKLKINSYIDNPYKIIDNPYKIRIPNSVTHLSVFKNQDYIFFNHNNIIDPQKKPTRKIKMSFHITHLSLNGLFTNKILIPYNITHLRLNGAFKKKIILPCSIIQLNLNGTFNDKIVISHSIMYLSLNGIFDRKIIMPYNLIHLHIGQKFDHIIKTQCDDILTFF